MDRSLWIAKTGMEGQQTKLDAIAHNLANSGTNGYKRAGVAFEDLMYQNLRSAGAASSEQSQLPTGLQVGLGVRAAATTRNFSQGALQNTGNNLDVAIKGQGFFQITMPDGTTAYTRDGGFQVDAAGQIVTNAGYVLQPGITVPANATALTIAANGTVSSADRTTLNQEFTDLINEIDRIAQSTTFNGVHLLDGTGSTIAFQVGTGTTSGIDTIQLSTSDTLASTLGLSTLDIGSGGNPSLAITSLDTAINAVSPQTGVTASVLT